MKGKSKERKLLIGHLTKKEEKLYEKFQDDCDIIRTPTTTIIDCLLSVYDSYQVIIEHKRDIENRFKNFGSNNDWYTDTLTDEEINNSFVNKILDICKELQFRTETETETERKIMPLEEYGLDKMDLWFGLCEAENENQAIKSITNFFDAVWADYGLETEDIIKTVDLYLNTVGEKRRVNYCPLSVLAIAKERFWELATK